MPESKMKASMLRLIKVYGLNAVLGFGLGVTIVLLSLTFLGRDSTKENRAENPTASISEAQTQGTPQPSAGVELPARTSGQENSVSNLGEPLKNSRFTVLLVGTDNRPGEAYLSNTDTLVVASIDQSNHRISFLSIPRDTQVDLPGLGIQKINAIARLQKGLPSTKKFVENLIGFSIDGYVVTNFNGFKNIVDGLGGITLTVEKDMRYDTGDTQDRYINLKKGTQRLTGTQALQYARFRNDELADISRTARQQSVLKAILAEATEIKNLPKIPFIIPKVYQAVQTDLNIGQLWSLANVLNKSGDYQTASQTLPGSFAIEKGISYWKINSKVSKKVVSQLFVEGKTTPIFTRSTTVTARTVVETPKEANQEIKQETPQEVKKEIKKEIKQEVKREVSEGEKKGKIPEDARKKNQEIQFEVIPN